MIHTHTIGRIGKDCRVITGTHGSFMAMDIAVDDYSKGQNVTTFISACNPSFFMKSAKIS